MRQESSELATHFMSRLRRQADFCGFGYTRNIQVRDQLIEGCLSLRLQLKLLERGNELSLDVALQMARCNEAVIQQASEMQAEVQVRSFLGLVNFSVRFISGLAAKAEPLRGLTQKNTSFVWGKD